MRFAAFIAAALLPTAFAAPAVSSITALPRTVPTTVTTVTSITVPVSSRTISVSPGPTSIPDNGSCDKLVYGCIDADRPLFRTTFNKLNCVAAFTCRASYEKIDGLIGEMWVAVNDFSPDPLPNSKDQAQFSINIFNQHSTDGKVWTQQNYIDMFYGALSNLGGPFPPVDIVIENWSSIVAWTGFCGTKNIPYQNLADWFRYSSTVVGATPRC